MKPIFLYAIKVSVIVIIISAIILSLPILFPTITIFQTAPAFVMLVISIGGFLISTAAKKICH